MNLADFAVRIEEIMSECTTAYECILTDDNDVGLFWNFSFEDSITGFIGIDNDEDEEDDEDDEDKIDFPILSIGLHLEDITDINKEGLLTILRANSELINASFSTIKYPANMPSEDEQETPYAEEGEDLIFDDEEENEPEYRDLLIIQSRIPLEAFVPEDFESFITNLMFQADMILNYSGEVGKSEIE